MNELHLLTDPSRTTAVETALRDIHGVHRLVAVDGSGGRALVRANVDTEATDHVVAVLDELGVRKDDYVIARLQVVAPPEHRGTRLDEGFAWSEVLGEARASARPWARYVSFMAAAGVIATYGVLDGSEILIVGAMAVAPDLMSAFLGVAVGVGQSDKAVDALAVLVTNVACLLLAGSVTRSSGAPRRRTGRSLST